MSENVRATIESIVDDVRGLELATNQAEWEAATTGTPAALDRLAEADSAQKRFFADADRYQQLVAWDDADAVSDDPLLARMLHLLRLSFGRGQQDPATIDTVSALEKDLVEAHTNYRAEVDGQRLTANDVVDILREETDSARRQRTWEASKEIGPTIADKLRRLAELRNQAAHSLGYTNYHQMQLELSELDPDWLFAMLDDLAAQTDDPFRAAKADLDATLADRFGVPAADLMPWHYAEPFFQQAPMIGAVDFNRLFEGRDLIDLATRTYDGLGMETRAVLERSDLYEREGKDQHAFCMDVDRAGDVRILCNLKPTLRWMDTLLHELGHAVYDVYIPHDLPWLLRRPAHILSTEAMALLMGSLTLDRDWHRHILGASATAAEQAADAGAARMRLEELIFARWVMVVVNFERLLYEDPTRNLQTAWWDLVERYQFLNRPAGRENAADWATKYHIALAPAYYQNYLLGRMMSLQWEAWLHARAGGIVNRAAAGEFFRNRVFALGATHHWNDALQHATGERLNPAYFATRFAG